MTIPPELGKLPEVRATLIANRQGALLEADPRMASPADESAAMAVAVAALEDSGRALGLEGLSRIELRGAKRASLTAIRGDAFLVVELDPARKPIRVLPELDAWAQEAGGAAPLPAPGHVPPPLPRSPAAAAPTPAPAAAPAPAEPSAEPPWGALRRALARGHLTRAAALLRELASAPGAGSGTAGAEPLEAAALEAAGQRMLEGIGSVLAGDPLAGIRMLGPLLGEDQPNLSLRWVARYWSSRAALQGGAAESARDHVKETLAISRQLDVEARGVSQLLAADLLARTGDQEKALGWLGEARGRFERVSDAWGVGHTWLAEARILAARGEQGPSVAAAVTASRTDPGWDEPLVFLAGRALQQGDVDAAETALGNARTPATERLRKLIDAVKRQHVTLADAGEFMAIHHAPPTPQLVRALERIANASPRFVQARESLAWMLVRLGRYSPARDLFTWLLSQPLEPADRALVTLGVNCTSAALRGEGTTGDAEAATTAPPGISDSMLLAPGARAGGGGADAMFSGRLSVFSLPDLVEFLRTARRSGLLVCSSPAGVAALRLRRGSITAAASPSSPSVGHRLVKEGRLAAAALEAALSGAGGTLLAPGLAGRLLASRATDAATLRAGTQQQIEGTLRELLGWQDGEFAFNREDEGPDPDGEAAVQVDPQALMLDLFREQDEATRDLGPARKG
jgi:predicted regulator of Ras-like GTPase activity (Roadblock/LC7/MglB family)